jgi:hypothetical protein
MPEHMRTAKRFGGFSHRVARQSLLGAKDGLFPENLLHVANFSFYFTGELFRGTAIPQIWVSNGFTRFLFDFADSFFCRALNLIFCT